MILIKLILKQKKLKEKIKNNSLIYYFDLYFKNDIIVVIKGEYL